MPTIWADTLDEHRRLVRQRLLDAFAGLLDERGYDGVTMSAVAARAGLARSAIYNYAADKHRLLFLHVSRSVERFVAEVTEAIESAHSSREQLRIYIAATLRSFTESAGAGQDFTAALSPDDHAELFAHLRPTYDMGRKIVEAGVADGTFVAGSAEELHTLLMATLGGYRSLVGQGTIGHAEAADILARVLLAGFAAPSVEVGEGSGSGGG